MTREGPLLEALTRRLARQGQAHVAAVVSDTLVALGGEPLGRERADAFQPRQKAADQRNRLSIVLIACWLLNDPWFIQERRFASAAYELLAQGLFEPAQHVRSTLFVTDADRREELARLCLKALDLHPAGETEVQALDRLATLNTAERARVIGLARAAEERARLIREAMAAQAAQEAADKWGRE